MSVESAEHPGRAVSDPSTPARARPARTVFRHGEGVSPVTGVDAAAATSAGAAGDPSHGMFAWAYAIIMRAIVERSTPAARALRVTAAIPLGAMRKLNITRSATGRAYYTRSVAR